MQGVDKPTTCCGYLLDAPRISVRSGERGPNVRAVVAGTRRGADQEAGSWGFRGFLEEAYKPTSVDEGLVLAVRAKARLGQALSASQHTEGHLQAVGGEWQPTSTRPSWNAEPRSLVLRRARSSDPNSDAGHETALFTNVVEEVFSEVP